MSTIFATQNLTVESCEGCVHRRPIIWWSPNFFCVKSYCPTAEFFYNDKCKHFEKLPQPIPPKKFSGFHFI